ncbi:MAG: WecB/TagA/CpsF family glycosyltransferase [Pseudomonadales bacterium]
MVFITPNLNFLRESADDPDFRDACLRSELSLADGTPLLWLARVAGFSLPHRVAGSDLFDELLEDPAGRLGASGSVIDLYFFGGPPGAAQAAGAHVNQSAKGLRCVGTQTPGFGSVEAMSDAATLDHIRQARPQLLVVSLGARKGTAWIDSNRERLSGMVISHLGAVVNFAAGTVSRAPSWMRTSGLEWIWRIREEPRLVERYAKDGVFLLRLLLLYWPVLALLRRLSPQGSVGRAAINADATGQVTVVLRGSLTGDAAERIHDEVTGGVGAAASVIIDLSNVEDVDARGLGILYEWRYRRHWGVSLETPSLKHWRVRLKFRLYRAQALLASTP